MTLTPGPSSSRSSIQTSGKLVYDAFLAAASLSEPQHTIYGF